MLLNLTDPVPNALKAPPVRDVIHKNNALRAPEVGGRDRTETLLAGGIPDLKLNALIVNLNVFDFEVDADSCDEGRAEGVICVAEE